MCDPGGAKCSEIILQPHSNVASQGQVARTRVWPFPESLLEAMQAKAYQWTRRRSESREFRLQDDLRLSRACLESHG